MDLEKERDLLSSRKRASDDEYDEEYDRGKVHTHQYPFILIVSLFGQMGFMKNILCFCLEDI